MLDRVICSREQLSFQMKVVMVTEDREFQTAGVMILNALDCLYLLSTFYCNIITLNSHELFIQVFVSRTHVVVLSTFSPHF